MILRSYLRLKIISLRYKKRQTCFIFAFETGLSMMAAGEGFEPSPHSAEWLRLYCHHVRVRIPHFP